MEEAQEREAAIERQPELATVGEASRPKVVFPPTLRSETLRLEGKVCSHDDYVLVRKHKPFDINSVPPKQEGKGWVLGSARQMLIKGYSLAHVIEATGWGKDWFSDIPVDADGYGLGTEAWLESLDKKDKKKGLSS